MPNKDAAPTLEEFCRDAKILLADDELAHLRLIELTFEKWRYLNVHSTTDSHQVLPLYEEYKPDIVLLDLMMPGLDGFDLMEQLGDRIDPNEYVPIVVFSADASAEARRKAWALGAKDFFVKPFDAGEFMLRVLNLLETRYLHLQLKIQNEHLEERVEERTQKWRAAQIEVLQRLGQAAEYRDDDTGHHTQRVGEIVAQVAAALGLPEERIEMLRHAAPLHDVGKIGISENILLKPGGLTPEEFEEMKKHTTIGAGLLAGGESEFLQTAERIALSHHERWDGKGYPHGLKGREIPLEARLVAIADVFDAMSHDRPYKKAAPREQVLAEIEKGGGTQFDPSAVSAFLEAQRDGQSST